LSSKAVKVSQRSQLSIISTHDLPSQLLFSSTSISESQEITQQLQWSSRHQTVSRNIIYICIFIYQIGPRNIPGSFNGFCSQNFSSKYVNYPPLSLLLLILLFTQQRCQSIRWTAYPFIYPTIDVNLYGGLRILLFTQQNTSTYTVDCVSFYLPNHRRQPVRWTAHPFIHPTIEINLHGGLFILFYSPSLFLPFC